MNVVCRLCCDYIYYWAEIKKEISVRQETLKPLLGNRSFKMLTNMLIVGEDKRFRYHWGIDLIAICRAFLHNIIGKHEGASTIDQQLVRVLTGIKTPTLYRKILEILLAIRVDNYIDKRTIALLYLDKAYYGSEFFNLDALLQNYGLNMYSKLDPILSAEIVARLKYPEPRNKESIKIKRIEQRVNYLLKLYNNRFYRYVYEYK